MTAACRNDVALTPDDLNLLKLILSKLHEEDAEVHDRFLCYLLDGAEEDVLIDLPKAVRPANKLRLGYSDRSGGNNASLSWQRFFRDVQNLTLPFVRRLTRAFAAIAPTIPASHFRYQTELDQDRGLEILLVETTANQSYYSGQQEVGKLTAELILEMLAAEHRSSEPFLTAPFNVPSGYMGTMAKAVFLGIAGLGKVYAARHDLVAPFLKSGAAEKRVNALETLARTSTPVEGFAEEFALCATDGAKTVREAAESLLMKIPALAQPLLVKLAQEGSRTQRENAIRCLSRLGGGGLGEILRSLAENEKSQPVQEVLRTAIAQVECAESPHKLVLEPPPRQSIDLEAPITPALRTVIQSLADRYEEFRLAHNQRLATATKQDYIYPRHTLEPLPADWLDKMIAFLERGEISSRFQERVEMHQLVWNGMRGLDEFLTHPDTRLIHVARYLRLAHILAQAHQRHIYGAISPVETFRAAHQPPITLLDLDEAFRGVGLAEGDLIHGILAFWQPMLDWEGDAVWPFVYTHLATVEAALTPAATTDWQARHTGEWARVNAYRLLATLPGIPPAIVARVWELALASSKSDRKQAQPIAVKLPDLQERLAQALISGNFQTRFAAAEWMGRIGDKAAIKPLVAAAKKEKQEVTIDAMLTALERLGEPIDPFLDRDKLQADAVKNLKKGTPAALEWFPFASLPEVRWQAGGERVPAETLGWLITQAFKLKNPEPGALLKRYCELFRPADRDQFGTFVLSAWLSQDLLRKYTDAECRQLAQKEAARHWAGYQQSIRWMQNNNQPVPSSYPASQQHVEELLFQTYQRECGSASDSKAVLAVAGACCGDAAVGPVQKYLKEWYGHRMSQCKALIAMLSGVDRPLAIQYLLSISNRFRTKGIREEAEKYVNLLAERKGWSLDELADRTMPTCGFDDEGRLELSFGPRAFAAKVNSELEVTLYDSEGKALKKLPDPKKDDDAEAAKAAKKTFSAAKTELKKFAGLTTTRLYEAMCTERTWPATDWRTYLAGHPLARFLCQRLVWAVLDGDQVVLTFRPLDDGTLTDVEDNPVELPADKQIRIAHSCNVPAEVSQAWARHLADYDVSPLFAQFGRPPYPLGENRRKETAIKDFQGHMLEAFKLRGLATKAGYTRGQAEDGGWFHEYLKTFPGLGLEVHLGFTGNGLPEENRQVALTQLTFARKTEQPTTYLGRNTGLALKDVPAVLLAECAGDLRTIAAAGTGFDPEWEKKAYL